MLFFFSGGPIGNGSHRIFWDVSGKHEAIAVAGLGNGSTDWEALENIDGVRENIRIAVGGKLLTTPQFLF